MLHSPSFSWVEFRPNNPLKPRPRSNRTFGRCDCEKRRTNLSRKSRGVCETNRSLRSVVNALVGQRFFFSAVTCQIAPRLSDESATLTERINLSSLSRRLISDRRTILLVFSSPPVRSRFEIETTQLHSSTSRRATYVDNARGYARGARVYTRPAGNNWWYALGRRVLHRAARRGTEKHPAAIYYRRLSIIDAGCIAVKRDSPVAVQQRARISIFFTAYWPHRTLHLAIFGAPVVIK